jgi:hypothetical protein
MNKSAMLATASALALLSSLPASALTLDWTADGFGSGTITSTTPGVSGVHTVTGVAGTFNGFTDLVLLPINGYGYGCCGPNDNLVYSPGSANPLTPPGADAYLDAGGVSFSYNQPGVDYYAQLSAYRASTGAVGYVLAFNHSPFNLFETSPTYQTAIGVSVAAATTPLPSALPLFAAGLGVVGLLARRRKRKAAALAA